MLKNRVLRLIVDNNLTFAILNHRVIEIENQYQYNVLYTCTIIQFNNLLVFLKIYNIGRRIRNGEI
jgi:hypothetical protein